MTAKHYIGELVKSADGYLFEDTFDRADGDLQNNWVEFGLGTISIVTSGLNISSVGESVVQQREAFDFPTYDWETRVQFQASLAADPKVSLAILQNRDGFKVDIIPPNIFHIKTTTGDFNSITETIVASGVLSNPIADIVLRLISIPSSFAVFSRLPTDVIYDQEDVYIHNIPIVPGESTVEIGVEAAAARFLGTEVRAHDVIHLNNIGMGWRARFYDEDFALALQGTGSASTLALQLTGGFYAAQVAIPSGITITAEMKPGDAQTYLPSRKLGTALGVVPLGFVGLGAPIDLPTILLTSLPALLKGSDQPSFTGFVAEFASTHDGTYVISRQSISGTATIQIGTVQAGERVPFIIMYTTFPEDELVDISIQFTDTYGRTQTKRLVTREFPVLES